MTLTQERLKSLLRYEPETGQFYWLVTRGKAVAGALAGSIKNVTNGRGRGSVWRRRYISVDGRPQLASRLAFLYMTGAFPAHFADHVNGDTTDDRWTNLRDATAQENGQNRWQTFARSGLLGVTRAYNSNTWSAQICHNRKVMVLGHFKTKEEAHAAYLKAKRELHPYGEIAKEAA